ncbi:hypothetical protein [Brevibacillus porteri]|uniref:SbsA Ig-like domain-containing protein n=1 Tax=Brevibacillus porteri TaxID=2126350 RepID=A0ABX5FN11_9BACL|nr:hypothetical protein [Brevibacillus porteri]MED1801428.1 hypothetical protein [Brevibacillus porteri]MED2133869.1 hypothetical protein [Brevibacillus porteri]MED2748275.1 hypothetical protein [Brevibacillus porteri]MED2815413.1 hypothetical protein [Brevibacillus porteri]MED2894780.1 hypothetical protein [Brevibacillus porteri]
MFDNNGALLSTAVAITTIDNVPSGTLSGKLSEDNKTLTVTATNALSKRYTVVIDGLKAKDGSTFVKYDDVVTFAADTTAPAIVSTVKDSASTFTVTFSEPIKEIGTVIFKYADGTPVTDGHVTKEFTAPSNKVTFTLTSDIAAGKTVIATFIGTQDSANNLLTPNPATVTMVKGAMDGVAPTVSAIAQTGADTFTVKFSEQLVKNPAIKIGTDVVATDKVVKDTTDPTLYHVTSPVVLEGAKTVVVSEFHDLSGEAGTETSKVVVFTKDAAAPKVASSNVVVDATDSKQYLELTFDKDVKVAAGKVNGAGTFVKDHITNTIAATETEVKQDATNKKVVRVNLDAFLGDVATDVEGATYNLDLTFTGVTSTADVPVEAAKATFTRGKDGVPASGAVAKVTAVEQGTDNNKVKVTFDQAVDGASATNAANYKIDGAVVESVTLLPAETANGVTTQVAVLNLKAGSNEFTGKRNINISDVKALGSTKVMEPYHTNGTSLNENVAPVVTSAKLTGTTEITLTFSEAVADTTGEDFEVLIGGQAQTPANNVDAGVGADAKTTVKVTIAEVDADKIAKGLSLKALETIDVKDAAGNVLSVPANIVVTQ